MLEESCVLHVDVKVQKEVFAKHFPMMVGKEGGNEHCRKKGGNWTLSLTLQGFYIERVRKRVGRKVELVSHIWINTVN